MATQVKIARIVKARSTGEILTDKNGAQYYVVIGEESLIDTANGVQLASPSALLYNLTLGDTITKMIEEGKPVLMTA